VSRDARTFVLVAIGYGASVLYSRQQAAKLPEFDVRGRIERWSTAAILVRPTGPDALLPPLSGPASSSERRAS
jgi:hypothetical protein